MRRSISWKIAANRRKLVTLGIITVLIVAASSFGQTIYARGKGFITSYQPGLYSIATYEDGDTIQVNMNGTIERIRMIGVNTPETQDPRKAVQCYGKIASNFTKQRIGSQRVRLVSDPDNTNRDRYGRLLRYVYLPDGTFINAELIKQGYGFSYTGFPFSKIEEFVLHQTQAQQAQAGLWKHCQPQQNEYGGYTSNDAP